MYLHIHTYITDVIHINCFLIVFVGCKIHDMFKYGTNTQTNS